MPPRLAVLLAALVLLFAGASAQSTDPSTIEFASQSTQGEWVVVSQVHLAVGGFIAIHDDQGPGPDSVLGSSRYLEAGNHTHVAVRMRVLEEPATVLAVLHEDDGNEQFDYVTSDGLADPPLVEDGVYVAAPALLEPGDVATITFDDQNLDDSIEVAHAYLPSGGFVAIHRESFLDGEYFSSTIGASSLLAPGNHTDIAVAVDVDTGGFLLAIVHRDSDGDGVYDFDISQGDVDPPYIDGGLPVLDRAAVRGVNDPPPTVGAGRDTDEGNDTPAPALGLLAFALLALAARRR